jgi:hypothetical protein
MSLNELLTEEAFWSEAWKRHFESYLRAPPRCGYWLASRFPKQESVLEIGGGSCRDSRFLATVWGKAVGSDFDEKTISFLQSKIIGSNHELLREDAFAFSFARDSFDVTFSNGFWVLFQDDEAILRLAREQARVTRKWMVILVHNGLNASLRQSFLQKSKNDALYDIRFFVPTEIERLVQAAGIPYRNLTLEKFGGRADVLYNQKIKGIPNPLMTQARRLVPQIYSLQSWQSTERIACVVELGG